MPKDISVIHPELRPMWKAFPKFTASRRNMAIARWLGRFLPAPRPPAGIHVEQIQIPGQDGTKIGLRTYRPRAAASPLPVLVWLHGGGFVGGFMKMDDLSLCEFVQELGIAVVSVDYRLAPDHPFPTPLDDCYTALKWVHDHAAGLGIDSHRIAVGGASAGGGLAACLIQLAHDRGEVHPVFQLLVYPMLDDRTVLLQDVPNKDLLIWNPESNRFGWESYLHQPCGLEEVPAYAVAARREDLSNLPPAWVGVGTVDLFYEEDVAYAERLKQSGVDCELVVVPGAFHGFDTNPTLQITRDFRRSQIEALKRLLSLKSYPIGY